MALHPRAGQTARPEDLVDVAALVTAYYTVHPDPSEIGQRVSFGTSGHRGSSLDGAFNDDHIAATTQAICDYRVLGGISGPLFLAKDTHALSDPAWNTALEVLAANSVRVLIDSRDGYTPTPALSHAILVHNRGRAAADSGRADGIVVTPSHNPPRDGGFKYNPPDGGPAGGDITGPIPTSPRAFGAYGESPSLRRRHSTRSGGTTTSSSTSTTCRVSSTSTRFAEPASGSGLIRSAAPASPTGAPLPIGCHWT
jgi:phosphoglucomutase